MIAIVDDHRETYGVEPICRVLPIAPSADYAYAARRADPSRLSARARSDAALMIEIRRLFEAKFCVYGVRKVWRQGRSTYVLTFSALKLDRRRSLRVRAPTGCSGRGVSIRCPTAMKLSIRSAVRPLRSESAPKGGAVRSHLSPYWPVRGPISSHPRHP